MTTRTWIAIGLLASACMGGRLELADPAREAADAGPDEDGGAATAATPEPAPEAPVWLDPAALDAAATTATELGLTPRRPDPQVLHVPLAVAFDTNSATLRPESEAALEAVRRLLEASPRITAVRVAAHSDSRGSSEYNLRLTAARALAVARWLVDHGVPCGRVEAVGYGEDRPITDNVTAGGAAQNRRVELSVIGVDGSTRVETGGLVLASPCDPGADPNRLLHPDAP